MRRSMLTAPPPVPVVGYSGVFGTTPMNSNIVIDLTGTSTVTGTLTSVRLYAAQASTTVRIFVGSLNGTALTVRSVQMVTVAVGLNTLSVSLAVVAGDGIGLWAASTALPTYTSGAAGTVGYYSTTEAPVVGTYLPTNTFGSRSSIAGYS